MDVHIPAAVTLALKQKGVDVLTAQEDGASRLEDGPLLERASSLNRVIFSQDSDFLAEANLRQRKGLAFAGVIYGHQLAVTIGQCIRDLEMIAKVGEPEDLAGRVEFLPLC
jgi:predicted nuclease of predicted toxin-antitoxin system